MKIKIPRSIKSKIKEERDKTFLEMSKPNIGLEDWEDLNRKYKAYNEMLKPSCRVTPDTLLIVAGNLAGILLILNFEKMDIVRSKAMSFVLKGRV